MLQVVASFAEAWIENTLLRLAEQNVTGVASFAEAWIEKIFFRLSVWGRFVASFAEAWIEKLFYHP